MSLLGYSQNSPFLSNPYLDIQSNNITMEDTAIPLLLQPMKKGKKKGKAVLAKPFSKNPYLFPSADSVREIPLAQNGLYFNNLDEYTSFQKNLKTKSKQIDGTSAIPYMRSDRTSILDEGKQLTTDNNTCIDSVTGLMIDCGSKEKTRFIGNSSFLDNYKKGNSDLQLVNGNFQIGDMVQATRSFKGKSGEPFDMKIISDINDDNITLTGTSGGNTFKNKIIKFNELKDYIKNGERNIFRPGKFARKELIQKERDSQTSPEVRQALQNRKENLEFQTYIPAQANYEYSLRDDSPMYNKYKKGNMPVLNSYFDFANNEEEKNKLINKLDKLGLAKLAKREEVENSLLNVFGTMGQENKWRKAPVTGVGIGTAAENLWERIVSPKNRSIGPGQIRFSELTNEEKEQFGIKKPKDLFDTDKVIPLMTYKDLQNKNYLLNQGKKLSQRISGTKGKDLEDLQRESTYYNHLSPILNRGKKVLYNDMRSFIENEENSYYRSTDEDFINKKVEEQISNREVKFSPKSYTGSVLKNWQTNLQRDLLNPSTEENPRLLPNVVIKSNKKMQDGGEIDSLLWEDYDEEEQVQPQEVVQSDNYKSIQQQAKELKSKQMEVERRLMKRQSFDDFIDFIDDPSESSNYTESTESNQYQFRNPYSTDINLPSAQVVTGDKEQRASYAMKYLMAKGLTKEAAAGIIGNAGQESLMFHPKVLSGERLGDKNTSYGAFQWHGPRMTKALNWMKQNNKNINSIDTHLDYALEEASQMGIMNLVNSAKSPEQAANIWRDKFEKPRVKDLNRAIFARQIYNKF